MGSLCCCCRANKDDHKNNQIYKNKLKEDKKYEEMHNKTNQIKQQKSKIQENDIKVVMYSLRLRLSKIRHNKII
jgi:hypothetical protein